MIERDGSAAGAATLGAQLTDRLRDIADRCDLVVDVRGRGLLQGIELAAPDGTISADDLGRAVTAACLERGLHINLLQVPGAGGVMRIAPPLTIEEADLHRGLDVLDAALLEVAEATEVTVGVPA
ncbi:aminotransferase class III-fold pyridoxal phosphate-dependent enzyme [Nakamurella leprariae]|uniref:Aminotransferase class III-fold pyridoxal phosphate-dependent enzyme n=1 Tax=Nakamurella leprariae TaxID=2803911 RepID=A0A938Y6F4_9ACTN|nr:aminotransferase class III-fold pyridoxal phosphate-dependent enzyme [Nakamurella leprariae]MBM9466650.1 aminotransferase class III-fold pyridoxal phosphate-dependent enzyme [Nakamurella leprariae]